MLKTGRVLLGPAVTVLIASIANAHPIPDVPVRSFFERDGSAVIRVEIDARCLAKDPHTAPYLYNQALEAMTNRQREGLKQRARDYVKRIIEFRFQPMGRVVPQFEIKFTKRAGAKLEIAEDIVVVTCVWKTMLSEDRKSYQIKAREVGTLSVLFLNHIDGKAVERVHVLFPGETSFLLDLSGLTATSPSNLAEGSAVAAASAGGRWGTLFGFLSLGFVHVVPRGLDHILFVLGLFLLSREWRPLLWQVTTFTLAHTITLGLSTRGFVSVPSSLVEPVIAGSIAVVALENIYRPNYTHWRLVVVFIFGLAHGLGFAGSLIEMQLPPGTLVVALLGFNIGVECGQLTVIALAFGVTVWLRDAQHYRKFVVVPCSAVIALAGVWWMVERIAFR